MVSMAGYTCILIYLGMKQNFIFFSFLKSQGIFTNSCQFMATNTFVIGYATKCLVTRKTLVLYVLMALGQITGT